MKLHAKNYRKVSNRLIQNIQIQIKKWEKQIKIEMRKDKKRLVYIKRKDFDNLLKLTYDDNDICSVLPRMCDCEHSSIFICKLQECKRVGDFMQIFNHNKQYHDFNKIKKKKENVN